MDPHAHLLSLGWAGPGHALDARTELQPYKQKGHRGLAYDPKHVRSSSTGRGLVKPLLISHRQNRFGVGKKAHEPAQGDQWWLAGFEKALGNIGKSGFERDQDSGAASPETVISENGYRGKHAGLYGFFVKGQEMSGTIGNVEDDHRRSKKRKNGEMLAESPVTANESFDGLCVRKSRPSEDTATDFEKVGHFIFARDREERRTRKVEKAGELEQFRQIGEFFQARSGSGRVDAQTTSGVATPAVEECVAELTESKDQRRERRRRQKAEHAKKAEIVGAHLSAPPAHNATETRVLDDEAARKAAREAERRLRKKVESRALRSTL